LITIKKQLLIFVYENDAIFTSQAKLTQSINTSNCSNNNGERSATIPPPVTNDLLDEEDAIAAVHAHVNASKQITHVIRALNIGKINRLLRYPVIIIITIKHCIPVKTLYATIYVAGTSIVFVLFGPRYDADAKINASGSKPRNIPLINMTPSSDMASRIV
jgi:hypothetical protein